MTTRKSKKKNRMRKEIGKELKVSVLPDSSDIIDFKAWGSRYYKKNVLAFESLGRNVPKEQINQFMHFSHSDDYKGNVKAINYIDGLVVHTFNIINVQPEKVTLSKIKAYPEGFVPINTKKINYIKFRPFLPEEEYIIEDDIFAWPTINKESTNEN